MSYKNFLTVVTDPESSKLTLEAAARLTREADGHIDALCVGVDHTQTGYYYAGATAMINQETLDRARKESEATDAFVKEFLSLEQINWSMETVVAQVVGLSRLVAQRANFSDLVILPKPYGETKGPEAEAIAEAVLLDSISPLLIVPEDGLPENYNHHIVIAWNESGEALRAVRHAMPLLRQAKLVDIVVVAPPQHSPERSDPGGRLSQMLSRHGIKTEISVLAKTMPRVSDVLARHLLDRDASMLVMGAYGHSRFREAILGGATRNAMENTEIPLFMAH